MAALGLSLPPQDPAGAIPSARVINIGGFMRAGNLGDALRDQVDAARRAEFERSQSTPVVRGLAARVKEAFTQSQEGRQPVERRMVDAVYARRGEYTPEKLAEIRESGQPPIYMMLASGKMRQVESLLRDVLLGSGADKPWTTDPTPDPELPPAAVQALVQQLAMEVQQAMASGFPPSVEAAQARLRQLKDEIAPLVFEEARKSAARMETRMEDQLLEGGFARALDQLITDIATFPTAFMVGPLPRNRPALSWGRDGQLQVRQRIQLDWERFDPFDVYPAPWATDIQSGPLILRHRLSRKALNELIGVEGYDESAVRKVIEDFGSDGLRQWLAVDSQKEAAEGRIGGATTHSELIDTLQYFGDASGQMLVDWGMDKSQVPDLTKEYQVEAWVVGPHVIKAVLNADPLARRNIYAVSFQAVPGSVWGNAPYDLMKDCEAMCNGAARALAANMGISSGPQVGILTNRIPAGADVTEMYPWKIWQFESDPMGSSAAPITFFQPQSNANELMGVYEKFSLLADEYTGIPRYMAGFNGGEGGAGRTASGMSMMITNASKVIKQVLGSIDACVLTPLLERLHYYNMRYGEDPDLKGDVRIRARGAMALVTKEAAIQRTNEFLQVAAAFPQLQQLMGVEGLAEVVRPLTKRLDLNPDRVVPPLPVLRQRMAQEAEQAMLAQAQAQQAQPSASRKAGGDTLQDGTPATDRFSPPRR